MKDKMVKRMYGVISLVLAAVMGLAPMTAYAKVEPELVCICDEKCKEGSVNPECEVCGIDISLCEGKEKEPEENFGPLTPDGNLTLVDDYGSMEAGGKQFITVVTKKGNYFYIIIDRDDEGDETVHFLNMVDEADLYSLMDDEEAQEYLKSMLGEAEKVPTPQPTVTPTPEPVTEEKSDSNGGAVLGLFLLLAGAGGMGYYYYMTKKKNVIPMQEDPDADYDEEEDYLAGISDEDMDMEEDEYMDEEE